MAKSDSPNLQSVFIAAITACLLMLFFGTAYRVLVAQLAASVNTAVLSAAALEQLPLQIGGWTGQEVPMDEAIVLATDTDAHINRNYSRHNNSENVWLYIAYGVKARDLMPHRPEVCYTGAGWTFTESRSMDLPLSDGTILPCKTLQFSRGTLNIEKVTVLNYYIVDGQYCRDVSLLRSKVWRGSGTVRYVAQVQIIASNPSNLTIDAAVKMAYDFAAESALSISTIFESTKDSQNSNEDYPDVNRVFGRAGSGQ